MDPSPPASPDPDLPAGERERAAILELTRAQLERYAGGDLEAFGELCARYYARVFQVVEFRLGNLRSRTQIEDGVQDVFVDALRGIERFDYRGPGSFMSWLATIAINRLNSERERQRAQKRDASRERALETLRGAVRSEGAGYEPEAHLTHLPDRVVRAEESELLRAALEQLPEDQRRAIELRFMLECTLDEVAELLGLPNDMAAFRLVSAAVEALGKRMPGDAPGA